ncbi:DUF4388 domain-containing protein [Candidatus Calescamantes bacterium]|nr:DUF4388 domain-containing protein [Candidatus Calescamantes bacterium]
MSLKGSLTSIHLADIVQLIGLGEKSGCLELSRGNDTGYIFFDKGIIIYGYSDNNKVSVERVNNERKLIDASKLKTVMAAAEEKGKDLVSLLDEGGLIPKDKLASATKNFMLETMYAFFKWTDGNFEFIPDKKPESPMALLEASFANLIMEGSRRIDEIDVIKKIFTSDKTRFFVTATGTEKLIQLELNDTEKKLLAEIKNVSNIYRLAESSQLEEFDLYKIVYGFHQSKIIEVMSEESFGIVSEHIDLAGFYVERENYEDALKEAERAFSLVPTDENIIALLKLCSDYTELSPSLIKHFKSALRFSRFTSYSKDILKFIKSEAEKVIQEKEQSGKPKKASPREALLLATQQAKKGDFKGVVKTLTELGEIRHSTYYLLLGNAYFKLSNMKQAYDIFSKSFELNPENEKIKKLLVAIKSKL